MKNYIFLEKNLTPSKTNLKYAYNYFYYITTDNKYIYNKVTPKKEVNFGPIEIKESPYNKITSFIQDNSQNILGNIFCYMLNNNLLDKALIKFTINNTDDIEKIDIIDNL
jgi:hypothetical protein